MEVKFIINLKKLNLIQGKIFSFSVFPSPNSGEKIGVSLILDKNEEALVTVYDLNGVEVLFERIVAKITEKNEFNLVPNKKLLPGIYWAACASNNKTYSHKIIVK